MNLTRTLHRLALTSVAPLLLVSACGPGTDRSDGPVGSVGSDPASARTTSAATSSSSEPGSPSSGTAVTEEPTPVVSLPDSLGCGALTKLFSTTTLGGRKAAPVYDEKPGNEGYGGSENNFYCSWQDDGDLTGEVNDSPSAMIELAVTVEEASLMASYLEGTGTTGCEESPVPGFALARLCRTNPGTSDESYAGQALVAGDDHALQCTVYGDGRRPRDKAAVARGLEFCGQALARIAG